MTNDQTLRFGSFIPRHPDSSKPDVENSCDALSSKHSSIPATPTVPWHDDPANPYNWRPARKYTVTLLLSAYVFNALMSSTMIAPALSQITKDLHISSDSQTQLVLSIFVLSYAAGYFVWAPLSEIYGRVRILQLASTWFLIWTIVCGLAPNKIVITVGRLFSGAGAAASLAISTGMLGEVWRAEQRGRSLAVLSMITNLGPCLGPVIGGVIAEQSLTSWRWAFWASSTLNALLQFLSLRFLHESHVPTILKKLRRDRGELSSDKTNWRSSIRVVAQAMRRPLYLVFTQPASQGIVIYAGLAFGNLYVLIVSIPLAFESIYHQSILIASLNYLSFGIGTTFGAQTCGPLNDYLYKRNVHRHLEREALATDTESVRETPKLYKPPAEVRLTLLPPAVLFMTIGLLLFGWTLNNGYIHWIIPNVAICFFGIGSQLAVQCTNAYMIDIFCEIKAQPIVMQSIIVDDSKAEAQISQHATINRPCKIEVSINWTASAMASIWGFKSLCGFVYPLFAVKMIKGLGWGWSFTLLGSLNLVTGLTLTVVMLIWGSKLRAMGRRKLEG